MNVKPLLRVDPGAGYGRHVDFESLRGDNMDIEPEIVAAGWRNFFQIKEDVYPHEVYDFWKTTESVGDTVVSVVDRINIIVTKELLEKVTECPMDGVQLSYKVKWMSKLKLNEAEVNRQLYGDNDPTERRASWLVPKARILFSILFFCILPRTGSRHQLSTLDEQCIFHLLNHHPINLPFLIFQHVVKSMKETHILPYAMLLTRVFRECGVLLNEGNRMKRPVYSYIDSTSIAKMGLKHSDREGAELQMEARIEGERTKKKSPIKKERSSSKETKSPGVRFFESGDLKRKGEPLQSEVPKQARRSPRVPSSRHLEARQSRESDKSKDSEKQGPKATRSLVSILQKDSARMAAGNERKRKDEAEKKKSQPQEKPRLRKVSAIKTISPKQDSTSTAEERPVENIAVAEEMSLGYLTANVEESHHVTDNPIIEEVVSTTILSNQSKEVGLIPLSELVNKSKYLSTDVQNQGQIEHSEFSAIPVSLLHRQMLDTRLVVHEEKRINSVIIREKPRRTVKACFKPLVFDQCIMHLLDNGYRRFYDQLKRVAREPYPTDLPNEPHTIYPVLDSTVIMVVPDFQPPYYSEPDTEKGKKKLHPDLILDDMSTEDIAEQVRLIDEACEVQRNASAICVYQDPGTSTSKALDDDPVGGTLKACKYNPLQIGDVECSYFVLKSILRNRPLWVITSFAEVLPWLGRSFSRLDVPDDLDLPESSLPVPPPLLSLIEQNAPSSDAYSTTIAMVDKPRAPEPLSLEQQVQKLLKDMKKVKKLLKKLVKQSGQ